MLKKLIMNPKNDHFLELSMWGLAKLNKNPSNLKKFFSMENYMFFAKFLDSKHPYMINSIAIKVLTNFISLAPPDISFCHMEIIVERFVQSKTITLRFL